MSFFAKIFKKSEKRNKPKLTDPYPTLGTSLLFGDLVSDYSALSLGVVFRCVDLISDNIAMLPIMVKKKSGTGKTNIVKNSPVNLLFDSNSWHMSYYNFIKLTVQNILLKGNSYAYIQRSEDGTPVNLVFLRPSQVNVNYDEAKDVVTYTIPKFTTRQVVPESDMLHFKKFTWNSVNGVSVLNFARTLLDTSIATEEAAKNFFAGGCNLQGVLKVNAPLTQQQREQLLDSWRNTYTSGNNGIALIQGNMDYQTIATDPEKAQMTEARVFNAKMLCMFFGVLPSQIGLTDKAGSNFEDEQIAFVQNTLQPIITLIEQEMTRKLIKQGLNQKIILDSNAILRTNKAAQASYYSTMVNSSILSINECRRDLGYSDVEGGDDHRVAYSDVSQNSVEQQSSQNEEQTEQTE